jgi:thiamine-monophosphate kinase
MCERSHVGANIVASALPIEPTTQTIARTYDRNARDLALYGGDDYELLFTVPPASEARALHAIRSVGGMASDIGWITDSPLDLRLCAEDGTSATIVPHGWDHLRAGPPSQIFNSDASEG